MTQPKGNQQRTLLTPAQRSARYRDKNWDYRLWSMVKAHNKNRRKQLDLTITREYIKNLWNKQNGRCFWTQVPMITGGGGRHPQQVSLDRIDSTKGYTPDNVVLSCLFANYGKCDISIKTFFEFLRILRETFTSLKVESYEIQRPTNDE